MTISEPQIPVEYLTPGTRVIIVATLSNFKGLRGTIETFDPPRDSPFCYFIRIDGYGYSDPTPFMKHEVVADSRSPELESSIVNQETQS